jgi:hypothetical protein
MNKNNNISERIKSSIEEDGGVKMGQVRPFQTYNYANQGQPPLLESVYLNTQSFTPRPQTRVLSFLLPFCFYIQLYFLFIFLYFSRLS